ncbi:PTS sugar transporter subunit IIA [Caldalkalibacillus salinus]|uniref:PTS sugar transporter subunit IIA n=1 Tax=Caldalkalibacillus salinus TaxID=2803787 RepID=UPI0019224DAA|nr:PTS sugar transporter subunit IIA [Caldalkalibacillus salinus]
MLTDRLNKDLIVINGKVQTKEEAIRQAGDLLSQHDYVNSSYVDAMLEREEISSTFMGNGIAIPHGTEEAKKDVLSTGISILQLPEGVDFGDGNIVKLIFGIAGKDNEHLELLQKIAILCSDEENVNKLVSAPSVEALLSLLSEEG